jgi:hypothetical protein
MRLDHVASVIVNTNHGIIGAVGDWLQLLVKGSVVSGRDG